MNEMERSWVFYPRTDRLTCLDCNRTPFQTNDRDGQYVTCACGKYAWYGDLERLPKPWVMDKDYEDKMNKVREFLKTL